MSVRMRPIGVLAPEGAKFSWKRTFNRLGRLFTLVRPYRGKAILSAVTLIFGTAIGLVTPFASKFAIDRGIVPGDRHALVLWTVLFVVAALLGWVASIAQTYLAAWVGQRVLADLRRDLFSHIQTLELGYFERNRAGWLISRLTNDVDALEALVTDGLYSSVQNTLLLVGTAGVAALQAGGWPFKMPEIVEAVRAVPNAWLHVDGAFGLWAAASPSQRHLIAGLDGADSWTTDAHKWLNVPYDCGIVAVADPEAHLAAMSFGAAYYVTSGAAVREPGNWVAESSRRSRAFTVYAALRELGRDGLADLVDRCCALARRMADGLRGAPGVTILNEVALNQVLVRFAPPAGGTDADADDFTRRVIAAVQADGTCWLGGTTWHGKAAMRISVSNWSTTEQDADVSVAAIRRCAAAVAADWAPAASPAAV